MNIEQKIAELDAQIADRKKTKDILYLFMDANKQTYEEARHVWAEVYEHVEDLKKKRELLIELQKDCECVISSGVPVPDEDIGRTVPLNETQFNGSSIRVPVFYEEREFIEPK